MLEYLGTQLPGPGTAPLCGNSIGVDRRFLDRYLPEVDQYLHYRSVDVSSLKELCRRWYPSVYKKRPDKKETHRALDDIRESHRGAALLPQHHAPAPRARGHAAAGRRRAGGAEGGKGPETS